MSSITLTSLAMLKVNIDQGKDYLDYLRPFILQILFDEKLNSVTDQHLVHLFRKNFGLEIPERAVQIVLKRISKQHALKKEKGVYAIIGEIPDPGIIEEKRKSENCIRSVILGLIEFSKRTTKQINSEEKAVRALLAFLSQFNIQCLRAFLHKTAIPKIEGNFDVEIILVSQFVLFIQKHHTNLFSSFLILLQGQMLANALLCPDLQDVPETFKNVTFFLDTPLILWFLGLEGDPKRTAIASLIDLIAKLGGSVAAFSHSLDEAEGVIKSASLHYDSFDWRGEIVAEARRKGMTKSDLLLFANQVADKLKGASIKVVEKPPYNPNFQIDEKEFEELIGVRPTQLMNYI